MKYSPQRVGRYKKLSLMSFRNVTTCFLVTFYFQRSLSSEEDHKHCRKVLLQRGQNKAGFHRDLLTYVEWDINNIASNSDLKSCHLLLLEHLPNGIYVDPDQIRSGEEFGGPQGQCSQLENQTGDSTKLDNGRGKKTQWKPKGRTRDNGNQERSKTRQAIPKQRSETVPVYEHLTDLIETTLCSKGDKKYHDKACISRTFESCGIDSLQLLEEEIDTTPNAPKVKWERFDYVNIQQADGQEKRKMQLVLKETGPADLFKHLKELLNSFPSHQFRASWQHEQLECLLDKLPQNHVCCIHDYSENYSCYYQNEVQSCYYSQTQASIHVTILHRHALNDTDGVESSPHSPLVTEHIFFISPDCKHSPMLGTYC